MKRLLVAALFAGLGSQAVAQGNGKIHLICIGWTPIYRAFDRGAENPTRGTENDSMVMELDKAARTIKLTTQAGPTMSPLEENDQFYWSTVQINRPVLDKVVSHISISINRMTGAGHVSYHFAGETDGKVAFTGKCAPGKAMF